MRDSDDPGDSFFGDRKISRAARIMMTTFNLPEGNTFGVDDIDSGSPKVEHRGENRRKRVLRGSL